MTLDRSALFFALLVGSGCASNPKMPSHVESNRFIASTASSRVETRCADLAQKVLFTQFSADRQLSELRSILTPVQTQQLFFSFEGPTRKNWKFVPKFHLGAERSGLAMRDLSLKGLGLRDF